MTRHEQMTALKVIAMAFEGAVMHMLESVERGESIIYPCLFHEESSGVFVSHHLGDFQIGNYKFICGDRIESGDYFEYTVEKLEDEPFSKTTQLPKP